MLRELHPTCKKFLALTSYGWDKVRQYGRKIFLHSFAAFGSSALSPAAAGAEKHDAAERRILQLFHNYCLTLTSQATTVGEYSLYMPHVLSAFLQTVGDYFFNYIINLIKVYVNKLSKCSGK